MSLGRTYKFFGFYISHTILNPPCLFCTYNYASYSLYFSPHSLPSTSLLITSMWSSFLDSVLILVVCLVCLFFQIQLLILVFVVALLVIVLIFFFLSPFNISYNKGLVMMNSFTLNLSGKYFICVSFVNDTFAGQSNLGCRSLLFITLNASCQSLLACKVSFEKSADNLMGTPLQITLCFSLIAFQILSLFLNLGIILTMSLGVVLFVSVLFGTFCASQTEMSRKHLFPLPNQGSFLLLFFQIGFQFLALSLLLMAPLLCECWKV